MDTKNEIGFNFLRLQTKDKLSLILRRSKTKLEMIKIS